MKKIVAIVGPTGSGKTGLSIALAKLYGFQIINGDSVQVYKRLNIGSAKIKDEDKKGVKHHLFDIRDPKDAYTVYNFQTDVRQKIDEIDLPMIVGGTGLYIKAALYDYEFIDEKKDDDFEKNHIHLSDEALYQELLKLDPHIKIDQFNRRRVLRALEQATQGSLRSKKTNKDQLLYDALIVYLDLDRDILEDRLYTRLDQQLKDGFIKEVEDLRKDDIHINAIGYKQIDQYLDNQMSYEDMKKEIVKKSRQLAKKQKTWFKNQMQVHMIDALSPTVIDQAKILIDNFLKT
ncbi:tRNA (adenosine(37)-N6)-dimethylallyltransferase MiaA [Mariniplasma anaerobium]|uniref:tRNA dimethylallyltransferase n=1 Tax=Mariniplasma anaerobium TaxID=2735436 RepID=A0A7U9TGH7_9MOLU|nr:tRNA (adenosine(37)-N6)-dimethylallyltransferase MiaA [Mariniplasma anaerobium]BCR35666.1 tRNA dimethylallyltransferase [Mariniplasma anaerobium]